MNKLIIIGVSLVLALILGFTLLMPKYQALQVLQANIQEKERELQSKTEYFSQIREIFGKLDDYEEELAKIASALPKDPSLPSLFNFLQRTSAQTGLLLVEADLGSISIPQEGNGSHKEIRVSLDLSGTYSALKNFLLALEESSRIIEIEKISFIAPEELAEAFSSSIRIKTHSY